MKARTCLWLLCPVLAGLLLAACGKVEVVDIDSPEPPGPEVEEEAPVETTKKTTRKSSKKEQQDAGGLGSILGNMGIDLGNIGDLAGGILKSIVLGGK